ncbi:ATP-binding protein [Xanthomonas translucens]|uniref:ATP-binding protein n=1 Tax=Xanthomonas campestris pv. translucens TaxID=343 RepID=UPI000A65DFF2|nr:ATP-binding protein [Xanthomonas translucens]WLA08269.1 putative DNA binding domain-containing protein [Xanthomonas translucens]
MIFELSDDALIQRIALGEDSLLEFKQLIFRGDSEKISDPSADSLADEIAAFDNSREGGVVVLGVEDRSRRILGVPRERLAAVQQWLGGIINDRIKGPPRVTAVNFEATDAQGQRCALVRINVPPSLEVHQSPGGYFERRGDSKRQIPPEALTRLMQHRSQVGLLRFEEQMVPGASFADLEPALCQRFLVEDQGAADTQLRRLHFLREQSGQLSPTILGVLVAASDPSQWLAGAWVQAVAYRGLRNGPADQVDAREYRGPVDLQIVETLGFIERNMKVGARKRRGRVDVPQYSQRALFEAMVNAVAHRDYSITGMPIRVFMYADRIDFFSPGGLPNTMSVESMRSLSLPRNELLCSLFARYYPVEKRRSKALGRQTLMDRRGAGVEIIENETLALAGRPALFEQVERLALRLTIPAADSDSPGQATP